MRILLAIALFACSGCVARPRAPLQRPVEFSVRADQASAQVRDAGTLTVATYNVHGLRNRAGVRRDLAALDDVLVWCLQEVPYADDREIESILPPGMWHVALIPVNRHATRREWESQVIASRFPLKRIDVWPLDDRGPKRRVALAARIDLGGRTVLVVNTDHEPSMLTWRDRNTLQAQRLRGNSANVRLIDHALAHGRLEPPATTGCTFRSGLLRSRLDRIYARGLQPLAGEIAANACGSDHLPVWGRFIFGDSTATLRRTSLANDALHPVSSGHAEGDAGPTVSSGD